LPQIRALLVFARNISELVDFKCFKNFRVDNLKRVNLIGGKNNIRKTAFLEGCFVNAKSVNYNTTLYQNNFLKNLILINICYSTLQSLIIF